jgi:hypothetical protein
MKKIFTTLFMASMLLNVHAALGLSYITLNEDEEEVITNVTKDTTIIISDFEEDIFTEKMVMSLNGYISTTSPTVNVTITRSAQGLEDEFCMGNCYMGNGELEQDLSLTINNTLSSWFAHYYPAEASTITIVYTFNDGVNPAIALTVKYCYLTNAVENVVAPQYNGKIYNLLGQEMHATELSELPKGIYIINGKKYIKQ